MYDEIKYEIQTNMWVSNVSPVVWSLVILTLVLMAVIHGVKDFVAKNNLSCYFSLFMSFANYFLHTVGTVSRQSLSHKSLYLAALELLFTFLLSAYENFMAVKLVVPISQKPFDNVKDLYDNNYTFLVIQCTSVEIFIREEYRRKYKNKFIQVPSYKFGYDRTKKYFWKQRDGSRYAAFDPFRVENYLINVIEDYTARLYECYKMFLPESAFAPYPTFFMFHSAIAPELKQGLQRFFATGIGGFLSRSSNFKTLWKRKIRVRMKRQTDKAFKEILRQKEIGKVEGNMITLGNCVKVFSFAASVIICSFAMFLWENVRLSLLRSEPRLAVYLLVTKCIFKLKTAIQRCFNSRTTIQIKY